ncbi:disease resistance protein RPV1-like isoform X2 [Rhodamnia argentea]|uniref:Disease resistance protein RPV1-like isoform X2 n=1 Tax=Rhodamnia argentea TaxID=178133 RepID=A0ABM3H6Z4_9MYRT|nr:disease resistance protein RPV1-like isoform X2 [Rhodamnia argentea]
MKEIVREVQQRLNKEDVKVPEQLVGVDPHVRHIMEKLDIDYHDGQAIKMGDTSKKVLGIYGIAGVGKTVLAKYVYSHLCYLYVVRSFAGKIQAEIEHHDTLYVQNKLISDLSDGNAQPFKSSENALKFIKKNFKKSKILLLLDDVKDHEQLSELVGKLDWLGPGSRVIVTSQRNDVLKNVDGAETFVLRLMGKDEALTLFCRHAFGADSPRRKFKTLSRKIVTATGRLPLALQVVGSSLCLEDSVEVWKETLAALKAAPHKSVQAALEKSYTNLDENEQQIFLDIACFFVGKDNRIPYYMWADCKYSPSKSILALNAGSLVEIGEDNKLRMHEILKNFGREMVKKESRKEPCKRSRLYDHEEALHVLKKRKGTEVVEALRLEFGDRSEEHTMLDCDEFDGLENLRFLKLDRADIQGNFGDRLSSLRWLDWQGCPKNINVRRLNLNLQNLVVLNLSGSQVDGDWRGWELLKQARKLKVLKLTGCAQLIATPEFPASMELERLILEGCSKLAVIHPSFGNLTKLVYLNLKGCSCLSELPDLGPMRALKELVIDGTSITRIDFQEGSMRKLQILSALSCERLTEISDSITHLKSVTYLALDGSDIGTLPEPIGSLEQLKTLSLKNCERLIDLPDGIGKLTSLQALDLSNTAISKLPTSVKDLKAMKVLRMRRTFIREFPRAILNLEKLEEIDFSLCRNLEGMVPDEIRGSSSLAVLNLSSTQICALPACLSLLSRLQKLDISRCDKLESLPELPSSLIIVR